MLFSSNFFKYKKILFYTCFVKRSVLKKKDFFLSFGFYFKFFVFLDFFSIILFFFKIRNIFRKILFLNKKIGFLSNFFFKRGYSFEDLDKLPGSSVNLDTSRYVFSSFNQDIFKGNSKFLSWLGFLVIFFECNFGFIFNKFKSLQLKNIPILFFSDFRYSSLNTFFIFCDYSSIKSFYFWYFFILSIIRQESLSLNR